MWKESYICRSLTSQSNVSLRQNVTETENVTPFTRLSTKNACEIDNPDVRAKVPILLISISVLFCFFLVSKSELWNPVGSRGKFTLCREYADAYNLFPENPALKQPKKCFLPFWHFHGHTWSFDMPYQSPSLCKHSCYRGECFEPPGHDGWSIRR